MPRKRSNSSLTGQLACCAISPSPWLRQAFPLRVQRLFLRGGEERARVVKDALVGIPCQTCRLLRRQIFKVDCRRRKRGGGCFNRINATPKKDSSHLALLNCKPEPMIYNDNRQFNQGIHNLLLCDGCCFPMAAGERPNSEERAQCRAFWLTQESSGTARTARGITTVRASRLRLLRAFSAVAVRPPGISYKRGIVAGCASRCE